MSKIIVLIGADEADCQNWIDEKKPWARVIRLHWAGQCYGLHALSLFDRIEVVRTDRGRNNPVVNTPEFLEFEDYLTRKPEFLNEIPSVPAVGSRDDNPDGKLSLSLYPRFRRLLDACYRAVVR